MKTEQVRCPICGLDCRYLFAASDVNRGISDEIFDYYRCPACYLILLGTVPPDLDRYYPKIYYSIPRSLVDVQRQAEGLRFKIELVRSFAPGGRLLEVGPATGQFTYLAKQAGFNVDAIEMDAECCEFISTVIGAKVIRQSDVCEALSSLGQYEVIALFQVIEHLRDPWSVLTALSEHLVDGGGLIVTTPNPDSFQLRIMGALWPHVDAPRHLCLIPRRLLIDEAQKRRLVPISVKANDAESHGWDKFGWAMAATNLLGHHGNPSAARKVARHLLRYGGLTASVLTRPIERSGFRGSSYTAAFRKIAAANVGAK